MSISGTLITESKVSKASVHAVVHRADGSIEDRGMIAYYHWFAPFRWIGNAGIFLRYNFNKYVRGWK